MEFRPAGRGVEHSSHTLTFTIIDDTQNKSSFISLISKYADKISWENNVWYPLFQSAFIGIDRRLVTIFVSDGQ